MSEESISTTMVTESPASWNTRYISPEGFTCQLTLRGDNGKELLERANNAIAHLTESGCIPFFGYASNNKRQETEVTPEDFKDSSTNNDSNICPIHNAELKQWKKNGKVWWSHKTEDGWCYGK